MSGVCSVDDCQKPVFARGWCSMHYKRNQRYGSPDGFADQPVKQTPAKEKLSNRTQSFLIDRNNLYTMGELAKLFKMSNRSLTDAAKDVPAQGEMYGRLAYSLPEVAQAVWGLRVGDVDDDDPYAGLKPSDRKAIVEYKLLLIKLYEAERMFIHVDEVHQTLATIFKDLDLGLSTLPDNVEREAGLTSEQLKIVDRIIDKLRRMLVDNI